jgi:integrase
MTSEILFSSKPAAPVLNRSAILHTIASEISDSTRKAYAQEMKSFATAFESNGWAIFPLNEKGELNESLFVEQVLSYLQGLHDSGLTYSTIVKTLSAVKHYASYENQRAFSTLFYKPVKAFMEGLARQTKAHSPRKAEALTLEQLSTLYKSLSKHSARDIRDRAMFAVGIATALRSQSLADLTLADVSPAISIDGVNIHLRFSKTDQHGKGLYIPVARSKKLDPIKALNAWIAVMALYGYTKAATPDAPLFPTVRGQRGVMASKMAHPSIAITQTLRTRLVEAEIVTVEQAAAYSSHSLRATFITLSNQAGVAEKDIASVSGHKDMTTLRSYDRTTAEKSAQTDYLNPKKSK